MSNIGSLGWSEYKESQSLMVKVTGWDCQLKVKVMGHIREIFPGRV